MRTEDATPDNPQYRAHVKRVFEVIGAAANGVNELDEVLEIVKDLGAKHHQYSVQASYLKVGIFKFN